MMYQWTPDMIRFMEDASSYSDYFDRLADEIEPYLDGCRVICDAGCGLGQLSEKLARRGFVVYACDVSKSAVNYVKSRNMKNVHAVECNLKSWKFPEKPDAFIFNFFGSVEDALSISEGCKRTIIISKNYKNHRFSIGRCPLDAKPDTEKYLSEKKINYIRKDFNIEFGQPFGNIDDAVLFFRIYSKDENKEIINAENVKKRLVEIEDGKFKFYLPQKKAGTMFIIGNSKNE